MSNLSNFFNIIDSSSISFRYPVDKSSNPVFKGEETIDVVEVYMSFEKTKNLLIYLTDLLLKNIETFKDDINWVIAGGIWNDEGKWDDSKIWNDGI